MRHSTGIHQAYIRDLADRLRPKDEAVGLRRDWADEHAYAEVGVSEQNRPSECFMHGDEGREAWRPPFRDIEVVRCDHLGSAYVVEMYLIAGRESEQYRSHHIHFVRDGRREVHALDDDLSQDMVDGVWRNAIAAMERGAAPRDNEAQFHIRTN